MPTILDLIAEREAATTAAARELREQIAKLSHELALADTELSELAITRNTLNEADRRGPDHGTCRCDHRQPRLPTDPRRVRHRHRSDARQRRVPRTRHRHRARDTEGMRAKLKRLTARHILAETEPGLFVLAKAAEAS